MGVRYKLLILLLFIAITPLLVVGTGVRGDLVRLGDRLALRISDTLVNKASMGLLRIVEDHARILHREKQLLESGTSFLASKIEGVLYGHSHIMTAPAVAPSPVLTRELLQEYYVAHRHGRQGLDVDFNALSAWDGEGRQAQVLPESMLGQILPLLRELKFDYPELALWIEIRLRDGARIVYPGPASGASMRRPESGAAGLVHEPTWSSPYPDEWTRRLVFRVTVPVRDEVGAAQGEVSIVVPVGSLLHKGHHVDMYSEEGVAMLVQSEVEPGNDEATLRIIAREAQGKAMHDHWIAPEQTVWLTSPDTGEYGRMTASLLDATPGVSEMPFEGQDALWAYAPIDHGATALMIVVPKADVIMEALAARDFILTRIGDHTARMGVIGLVVALMVAGIAILLSKVLTRNIAALVTASGRVAKGDFTARADVRGRDEIGQLGAAFNRMVPALAERVRLKSSLEVAQQVQQSLLPDSAPDFPGADMAAISRYCDETGGDYYGFIQRETPTGESCVVAVGDVSGHGIPAALLMASARAYLRCHAGSGARLDEVVARTNRRVFEDVDQSGRFMTLFLLEIEQGHTIRWVRAGHDPALVYDPSEDRFDELSGEGLPLGVTPDAVFTMNERSDMPSGQVIIIGTDGIWEMQSPDGEMFGKERLKKVVRAHHGESSASIIRALVDALGEFQSTANQEDDLTVAVIKLSADRP
ncbi:PP2C family protein-serine/threonine phosphatase [Pseudodesulfovibrio pelocollis]|uniref:PP2C family protein-serine/threonine phosphatase n=1 Tax=Pseudodesulfovibrio pelocollis TaxID=3051432 RepID=UPI00255AC748|nr:PP2C family protein-serine/threonine phosphatase [Pseudodesulfovibrio sp. SB368]